MKKVLYIMGKQVLLRRWVFPVTLFLIALGVRIPWLWEVPRYIDELKEVNLAYQIYLGKSFPLHNVAHEIGAMHNYILAGIFRIFGPSIYWPRLYVALISAGTVLLIYILGNRLYNQWTGFVVAGLLLTNGMHILVTHMAWANCTTSFFFVLAVLAIVKAEELRQGRWLIIAGLLWAFTLQTHSSVIIYLLVIVVYVFTPGFQGRAKIEPQYYFYAGLAFAIGYANMIYYNIISRGGSIGWIFVKNYTLEPDPGLASFGHNFISMFIELIRIVSADYLQQSSLGEYLVHPFFVICIAIFGLGVYFSVIKQKTLPVWLIAGGFIVIPWINHRYGFFIVTRYIMPIVICSILLIAYGITNLFEIVSSKISNKRVVLLPFIGAGLIIGGVQLIMFYNYCSSLVNTDMSNRITLKLVRAVEKLAQTNHMVVFIDNEVRLENDPLPLLLPFSKYHEPVLRLGLDKKSKADKVKALVKMIKKYPKNHLIVIISNQNFQQLKKVIQMRMIRIFNCRLLLHNHLTSGNIQTIYMAEIIKPIIVSPKLLKS